MQIDLNNPKTDPKKLFEEYLRILVIGHQICHQSKITGNYEIVYGPQIRSFQLMNQIRAPRAEQESITEMLLYIWQEAGWINEGLGYKSVYGWEYDITSTGMKILKRIVKEENNKEVADK